MLFCCVTGVLLFPVQDNAVFLICRTDSCIHVKLIEPLLLRTAGTVLCQLVNYSQNWHLFEFIPFMLGRIKLNICFWSTLPSEIDQGIRLFIFFKFSLIINFYYTLCLLLCIVSKFFKYLFI